LRAYARWGVNARKRQYPGFAPGPYKEYSAPGFGDHKVLRGGCWATRARLIRHNSAYSSDGAHDHWVLGDAGALDSP
jgi:formylglycine-generating enzyme required for sulfatase activity